MEGLLVSIVKNAYPILEYSTEPNAVINPKTSEIPFPKLCLMTFFNEVLLEFVDKYNGEEIGTYRSEMGCFPVYQLKYQDKEICFIQAVVASGSIAMMTDYLYGKGVEVIVACGGCGVLDNIPAGHVIVPIKALRDEGASYKYLPPSRYIELNSKAIQCFEKVLEKNKVPFIKCMTWTTDGLYRETTDMVEYRLNEGCQTVEMECATMAAVAKFRNKVFGQLLYSGDILADANNYDLRNWFSNYTAREKLFYLSLEALCLIGG
jgi:purine-nucleoside phosphorylase